jgi:membrane protease YdiL (CAAX protease family)
LETLKLLPEFTVEDFKEVLDNMPILLIVCLSILWSVIAVLYNLAIYNTYGVIVVFLFLLMTIGSISAFSYADIMTDFRERRDIIIYIFGVTVCLALIVLSGAIIGQFFGQAIIHWNPYVTEFEVKELNPQYEHVYINFQAFSTFFRVDTTLLYDIFTNMLLVAPAEELVFRGIVPYMFARVLKSPWTGGIISTAVWSASHTIVSYTGPEAWTYVLICFVGGFFMFYMMIQTQDITVPILAHGIYNSMVRIMVGT